jgi:hypothetical protein
MARTISTESKQITTSARTREILIRIPAGGPVQVIAEREVLATSGGVQIGGSQRGRTLQPTLARLQEWKEFPAIYNAIASFLDTFEAEVEQAEAAAADTRAAEAAQAAKDAAAQDNG